MLAPQHTPRHTRSSSVRPFTAAVTTAVVALGLAACSDAPTAPVSAATAAAPAFSTGTLQGTSNPASLTTRANSAMCMDAQDNGLTPGKVVQLWTCTGSVNQQFVWNAAGEIRHGALCVADAGGGGQNGDALIVWTCNGTSSQHWTGTADGRVVGINGRCMDAPWGRTANGTVLQLWDCYGGLNQTWDEHVSAVSVAATGTPAQVLAFVGASNVPTVAALQAKGGAYSKYESDFASYANRYWQSDSTSFDANFYDRAMIYYVWWARTGNATYLDRANKLAIAARTWLQSENYYPPAYNMMIDGVALHALVTGDQQSATTVAKVADAMGNPNGYWYWVAGNPGDSDGDSRTSARVLSAVLDAYLLKVTSPSGYNYAAILPQLESRILTTQSSDGAYRWPANCNVGKPFMTGMLDDALIRYYTSFQADPNIVPAVKKAVDYMWNVDWVPSAGGFRYLDADCNNSVSGGSSGPTSDLNNLITSGFAFVAKQTGDASYYTKADASFSGGVNGAWLAGTKQFNQEYTASYRFLALRF